MNGEQLKIYSFWGILQRPRIATKIPGTPYPIEPMIYVSVVSKLRRVSLQNFRQKKKKKKKNIKSA